MINFTVIDTTTGTYPDLEKIALTEDWAKHLIYCDMEGFAISEEGELLLLDECGGVVYCPEDRFEVVFDSDVAPKSEVEELLGRYEDLKLMYSDLQKDKDELFALVNYEKTEVAREIFEEIERLMLDGKIGGKYPAKVIHPDKYAELKKKYTEGK